ncbi:MAG: TIGR00730 family Rossman fold protein [Flavobacteriales bacterium]|nr:TIGR00730 family Rossman fold protein [Flavobacteriales bacterium]
MKSISIFCASSRGNSEVYYESAKNVGAFLAKNETRVVFGGSKLGLMGAVADGALEAGGQVIGVLPIFMRKKEIEHAHLTELILVQSMHERKLKMHELSDGVIALPGGFGTFEELFEMLTWAQLGLHSKAIGILNVQGYYDKLLDMFDHMTQAGLLRENCKNRVLVDSNIEKLIAKMEEYQAPPSLISLIEE